MEDRAKESRASAARRRAVGSVQVLLACLCGAAFFVQRTCGQAAMPPYIQGSWKVIYKVGRFFTLALLWRDILWDTQIEFLALCLFDTYGFWQFVEMKGDKNFKNACDGP